MSAALDLIPRIPTTEDATPPAVIARNPAHWLCDDTRRALRRWDLEYREARTAQERTLVLPRPQGQREFEARIRETLARELPDLEAQRRHFQEQNRVDYAELVDTSIWRLPRYFDPEWVLTRPGPRLHGVLDQEKPFVPVPPPPDGEFWWAETNAHTCRSVQAAFLTDGLHFFGGIGYDADPLMACSVGQVARFELHPNRRPPSPNGRFVSAPTVELFGRIEGFTGVHHWLFQADDKWCKCWLHIRQTAFQLAPDFRVLASRGDVRTLIDEENNGRFVEAFLPGFLPMPAIEFGLADPGQSIFVDLEIRFDIQLEGWSHIKFSPEPNPMQSVLVRTFQWKIQPV